MSTYSIPRFAIDNNVKPKVLLEKMRDMEKARDSHRLEPYTKHQLAIEAMGAIVSKRRYLR